MRGYLHSLSCNVLNLISRPRLYLRSYGLMKLVFSVITTLCLATTSLQAELRLTGVITDHAVLQRDVPIHLWGEDSPAARITITFHGQSIATTASSLGLWEAWLPPEPGGGARAH